MNIKKGIKDSGGHDVMIKGGICEGHATVLQKLPDLSKQTHNEKKILKIEKKLIYQSTFVVWGCQFAHFRIQ